MKNLKSLSLLAVIVIAFSFGACSQDDTMDEIVDNTEISSPSDPDDEPNKDNPLDPEGGGD